MQKYDVVLLVDAGLSDKERTVMTDEIEAMLGKNILLKDEMGLQMLSYNLKDKAGNDKAYIYSYYVQAPATDIADFKKQLVYNKAVKRYAIYCMDPNQEFFTFADIKAQLEKIIASREEKKLNQKLIFYTDKKNKKYINWKAIPMLKKYVTRFGNIKPRKYTGNNVSTQKKIREAILRARELGLLAYVKE
ncbi:MAG: 30S ribosomal protein S18 [Candidatus Absconditabacterales bacterium]|jgi:ribosomal protein S18/ribosomal protein S6